MIKSAAKISPPLKSRQKTQTKNTDAFFIYGRLSRFLRIARNRSVLILEFATIFFSQTLFLPVRFRARLKTFEGNCELLQKFLRETKHGKK